MVRSLGGRGVSVFSVYFYIALAPSSFTAIDSRLPASGLIPAAQIKIAAFVAKMVHHPIEIFAPSLPRLANIFEHPEWPEAVWVNPINRILPDVGVPMWSPYEIARTAAF